MIESIGEDEFYENNKVLRETAEAGVSSDKDAVAPDSPGAPVAKDKAGDGVLNE